MKTIKQNLLTALKLSLGVVCLSSTLTSQAQEESKGKPIVTIFSQVGTSFNNTTDKVNSFGFDLERAYLGYQYSLNEHFSAKVVYDMGKGDDNSLQRSGYVKNAQFDIHYDKFSLSAGLTSTAQFSFQEKFWGYRYIMKSFQDEMKWGSSADLGVLATFTPCDMLSIDASVFNGEGYKKIQADDQLLYGLGITFKPIKQLSLRVYSDIKTKREAATQNNLAIFLGYKDETFAIGGEYNKQFNNKNVDDRTLDGLSVYGKYKFTKSLEGFVRYDYASSNCKDEIWQYSLDGNTVLAGVDWKVNKLLHLSPNFKYNHSEVTDKDTYYVMLSAKINL